MLSITLLIPFAMGIFRPKKYELPNTSLEPGWEGSDEALLLAQQIVFQTATDLEISWFQEALKKYMAFLGTKKKKVTDDDFVFIQQHLGTMWDLFRLYMLRPEVGGKWSSIVRDELHDLFLQEYSTLPLEYQPPKLEGFDLALLACASLERCLLEDRQILANAVFEVIDILWCHYLRDNPNRRG